MSVGIKLGLPQYHASLLIQDEEGKGGISKPQVRGRDFCRHKFTRREEADYAGHGTPNKGMLEGGLVVCIPELVGWVPIKSIIGGGEVVCVIRFFERKYNSSKTQDSGTSHSDKRLPNKNGLLHAKYGEEWMCGGGGRGEGDTGSALRS